MLRLPLPDANFIPGGPITAGLRNANAVTAENLDNEIKRIQAQYAPLTTQAEAASKLAYANLMGPQFLSKLLGNEAVLANFPDAQSAIKMLAGISTGQPNQLNNPDINNKLLQNPLLTQVDRTAILNQKPGDAYKIPQTQTQTAIPEATTPSVAQNLANFKGTVEEGKESGKIRAKDIENLNDVVFNGETNQTTLDNIAKILRSPEFEQIRQLPIGGRTELSYYSKFGTPEQQNMIGQYQTLIGNIIKDSARDFPGQFRKGEQQLLQSMKPTPSDTVDTARGKLESLLDMNKMLTERARLTSKFMSERHINKLQAQELADKQINGDSIRQKIHDQLNPTVTIRNKKTGEVKTISISEARKLGVPNV